LKETVRIKKEQAAARLQAAKAQEELMGNVMLYGSVFLLFIVLVACGLMFIVAMMH